MNKNNEIFNELPDFPSPFLSAQEEAADNLINKKYPNSLSRGELINEIRNLGFKKCTTASRAWQTTYFNERVDGTMLILIRAMEIDILKTPSKLVEMLNDDGKVKVYTQAEGHQYAEYHYAESNINIHKKILTIATSFTDNQDINQSVFCKIGINKKEWSQKNGVTTKRGIDGSTCELYDAISNDDGEPAYLGDRVWIESSGRTYDRGR